jgi:hypothetical protein
MIYDLTRFYPTLSNGKSFRPVDFLLNKKHPEVYVYDVSSDWKQVILVNNDVPTGRRKTPTVRTITAPVSGDQADTGSLGLDRNKKYYVFDFWNQKPLGIVAGSDVLSADLWNGQALVYSVKQVEDHPVILGTNRHAMCGMMEISKTSWDRKKKTFAFTADLVKGETMNITIAVPEGAKYQAAYVKKNTAKASFKQTGRYVTVSASSNKNRKSEIKVIF